MLKDKNSLYGLLKEVIREHFIRREKFLSEVKLFRGQAPVLLTLKEKDGLSQKEIVETLRIKPSTVNLILRRMEKRGLIKKEKGEKDRRFSKIYLTEEGKKVIERLEEVFRILEEECFMEFSEEEKKILRDYLKRIRDNLKKLNEESGGFRRCGSC